MFNRTSFCTKANCTSPLTGFPKQESACTIHFLWQLLGPVFIHCASLNPGGPYSTLLMTHCLQTEADTVYRLTNPHLWKNNALVVQTSILTPMPLQRFSAYKLLSACRKRCHHIITRALFTGWPLAQRHLEDKTHLWEGQWINCLKCTCFSLLIP